MNRDNVTSTIEALLNGISSNNIKTAEQVPETIKEVYKELLSKKNFISFYDITVFYPFRKTNEGMLRNFGIHKTETIFLLQHSDFIQDHYERLFIKFEGVACSADKSGTILFKLFEFLEKGTEIYFNEDQQYTYHLPKVIFKDHESIVLFFKALMQLYYGQPENYIKELLKLSKIQKT